MAKNTPAFSSQIKATASSVSQSVKRVVDWMQKFPLASFQILENLEVETTAKPFAHSLKRVPKGYIVIRNSNHLVVFDEGFTSKVINLRAAVATTCTIFLF